MRILIFRSRGKIRNTAVSQGERQLRKLVKNSESIRSCAPQCLGIVVRDTVKWGEGEKYVRLTLKNLF